MTTTEIHSAGSSWSLCNRFVRILVFSWTGLYHSAFSWTGSSYHIVVVSLVIQGETFSKQPRGLDMLGVAFVVPQCESTRPDAGSGDPLVPKDSRGVIAQQAGSSQLAAAYHQP
jgi:hypothetical protein